MKDLEYMRQVLPAALIASLAGIREVQGLHNPAPAALAKISFAARIAQRIEAAESREVAGSWLVSANEALGDDLPIKAIRDGRFDEVEAAATRFVHGWAG